MSTKNSITKSDYIPWNEMNRVVEQLYDDGDYVMSLFVLMGSCLGLRVSNLLEITWANILDDRQFMITEAKTHKRRTVRINGVLHDHAAKCYDALGRPDKSFHVLCGRCGTYTREYLNRRLKQIKSDYGLSCEHISTHSLRKTFGRHVVEKSSNPEMELIRLSQLFNHSNTQITRIYLGITSDELMNIYDRLYE